MNKTIKHKYSNLLKSRSVEKRKKRLTKKGQKFRILKTKKVDETDFGGYNIDLFFGLLYLKTKHRKTLGLPFDIRKIINDYAKMIRNGKKISFMGCLIYKCKDTIINKDLFYSSNDDSNNSSNNNSTNNSSNKPTPDGRPRYKYNKKDFVMKFPGLSTKEEFMVQLDKLAKSGKKYSAIPIVIRWSCSSVFMGHANILLINLVKKTFERFEPYGRVKHFTEREVLVARGFDDYFKQLIKGTGYTYYKPNRFCPLKGPQELEENYLENQNSEDSSEKDTDPEGMCGAWSLWYADLRMSNPSISRKEIINKAIIRLDKNDASLRAFIRNYSKFVTNKRRKFLRKLKLNNQHMSLNHYISKFNSRKTEVEQMLKSTLDN